MEIYIHVPFCIRKCGYCDFLSFPSDPDTRARYTEALLREIREAGQAVSEGAESMQGRGIPAETTVSSVFIGGGTPSVLTPEQIRRVMETAENAFDLAEDAEISMEVNPGTTDAEAFRIYREAGMNRISIGCQSMKDSELKRLGRIHTHAGFLRAFRDARDAGFDNINIDLISAVPGQSLSDWKDSLKEAAELNPEHISAYSLILEEGTYFYEIRDRLNLPDEDTEREMYECTREVLAPYGYRQYEISNYAKPGYECRHNAGYWRGVPYLGFGLGASSLWEHTRYRNTEDMSRYLECLLSGNERRVNLPGAADHGWIGHPLHEEIVRLSDADEQAEFMILGLRMTDGIRCGEFQGRFGKSVQEVYGDVILKYEAAGLLETDGDIIRLTRRGISLSNVVMADFLP